jgi:ABC-type nickel/cobalt efflux system permease component RcnA
VVISSYLVANEVRLRRGVALAFVSALLQAVVAVGIVGVMAMLLNLTSAAMTGTANLLETGSFALVAALGIYLLATKGRQALAMARGGDGHAQHYHGHHHHGHHHSIQWDDAKPAAVGVDCACGHHVSPAALERPGLVGAAAAVLSVGIRPCTGALVVLVFALAQGIFWAGVASTFIMALGTAITVAALAGLAVGAKDIARRLARGDDRRAAQVMLSVELLAALFITGARRGAVPRLADDLAGLGAGQLNRRAMWRVARGALPGILQG